jgi:hypothetical protein
VEVGLGVVSRQVQKLDSVGILEDGGCGNAMRLCHRR